jgi:hypothetical protein
MTAYHDAFTSDSIRIAFMAGLVLALGFSIFASVTMGFHAVGFAIDIIAGTMVAGTAITVGRFIWNVLSDAARNAYGIVKTWAISFWDELKGSVTGEYTDFKGNQARATMGTVR